jgi:hypothetical protein
VGHELFKDYLQNKERHAELVEASLPRRTNEASEMLRQAQHDVLKTD